MIIGGGSRANWRFFAKHLTNTKDNARVNVLEIRGMAGDSVYDVLRDINAIGRGTGCKNPFYHADINPREDEALTPEQREEAVDTLERNLGFDGQPRVVVEHEKNGRTHWHVIWSRIDTNTMTVIADSHNYAKHQRTARELERAFGHESVKSVHGREPGEKRPPRRARNYEYMRVRDGQGMTPDAVAAEVTALWREHETGRAFAAALGERGYALCQGDRRDFCIVDPTGFEHSLVRRIEGARKAAVMAKMADVDRDALPSVAGGKAANPERERRQRQATIEKALRPAFRAIHEGRASAGARAYMQRTRAFLEQPTEPEPSAGERPPAPDSRGSWRERIQSERLKQRALEPEL